MKLRQGFSRVPRKPHPKNAYLEMHDGYYRVTMGVPARHARQSPQALLGTKPLISADVLKVPIVEQFKSRIVQASETIGGRKRSEFQKAVSWTKIPGDTGLPGGDAHDPYAEQLSNRVAEIRQNGSRHTKPPAEPGQTIQAGSEANRPTSPRD